MKVFNQKGFTLVQVLLALALSGGLALMIMQQQKMASDTQLRANLDQDVDSVSLQIQKMMSNRNHCTRTVMGKRPGDPIDELVPEIVLGDVDEVDYLGNVLVGPVYLKLGDEIGNTRTKLSSMMLVEKKDPLTGRQFSDALRITFKKGEASDPKPMREVTRDFYFRGERDVDGKYINCFSETQSLVEQSMAQACKAMEGEFTPERKKCQLKNLPQCTYVTDPGHCGTVFTASGNTVQVQEVTAQRWRVLRKYVPKKWPLQCRLFSTYYHTCFCGDVDGPCLCPGKRKSCRTEELSYTRSYPQHHTRSALLTECCRRDI